MTCRHCKLRPPNRARGLCGRCYYRAEIRDRYLPDSKFAWRGVGGHANSKGVPEPTTHLPATEDKVRVLEHRAEQGLDLFHPRDSQPS